MDRGAIVPGFISRLALSVIGCLTIAMLLLAIFNPKGMLTVREQSRELDQLNTNNERISAEIDQTRRDINDLRTDPATIERIAREELKLVHPGEIVLTTPDSNAP